MPSTIRLPLIVFAIPSLAFVSAVFSQGPLAPSGSPAPTMKSLNQIDARVATAGERVPVTNTTCPGNAGSVYVISASGSYFLTADLAGVAGKNGVTIDAANVTLDLNGYTVAGPGLAGVSINNTNVTLRNGRVMGWSGNGVEVNLSSPGPRLSQFDSVVASDNGGSGFYIFGPARFERCQAARNATGYFGDPAQQFVACLATGNAGNGFIVYDGCTVDGCISQNDFDAYDMNGTAVVRGSTASDFIHSAFNVYGKGVLLQNCVASTASADVVIGFRVIGENATLDQCTATFTGGSGGALGYTVESAVLTGCTATGWKNGGFYANNSTLSGCNASQNGGASAGNGIACENNCLIVGNTARQNAFNGIGAGGVNNRIDGNTSINNGLSGIEVGNGNVVVRNISRGNATNYSPASGPDIGPTNLTPATATSPWANF